MEQVMAEVDDGFETPVPLDENDHMITVRRCDLRRRRLIPNNSPQDLNLVEAVGLLAPSKTRRALANVVKLKPGQYIGIKKSDSSNFVIVNPTRDGDIRWLLSERPDLANEIDSVYLVDGVRIRRNTIDLTKSEDGK